jgi:hypothetical protein
MLSDYENGNEAGTRENAEAIMNLLVGDLSRDHKDWNGDEQITDPGDGYGFLLNGDQLGYIRAVYSQADYAVNASGSSRNMIVNGENVKTCAENLARWAPDLRDQLLTILNSASLSEMDSAIFRSAAVASTSVRPHWRTRCLTVLTSTKTEPLNQFQMSAACWLLTKRPTVWQICLCCPSTRSRRRPQWQEWVHPLRLPLRRFY